MNGQTPTRGERDHNPGNLRDEGIAWEGLANPSADSGGYCIFVDDFHGLRALARDLHTKWLKDGLNTIAKIIPKYAPAADDNDVAAYESDLCGQLGLGPDDALDLSQIGNLAALVRAVIRHEQGRCVYAPADIAAAVTSALQP